MARRAQRRASGRGDDVETWQWVAALRANGGDVTAQRLMIVSRFIAAEKAAGTWALTDDYWVLWGENEIQALVSLKQKRLATAVAAPVFTADRGYTFDGVANYINTGFVPATHNVGASGSSLRLAVYERTNVGVNASAIGLFNPLSFYIRPRNATTGMLAAMGTSTAPTYTLLVADSRGWSSGSRAGGGTVARGFKNGVAMSDVTGLTVNNTASAFALFIGAQNNAGPASAFRAASIGLACYGAALSDAQEAAQYANVQAWATAVGANV